MNAPLHRDLIERARGIDILSVALRYGARLRNAGGSEFVGPCPRCGGRDRFAANIKKRCWNCRGCTKGGDVIDLVRHLTGMQFGEAVEVLTGETWPTPHIEEGRHHRHPGASSDHRALAGRIWRDSGRIFGTSAERYLVNSRHRGGRDIDIDVIPEIDAVLRFHPRCWIVKNVHRPSLIALIRDIKTDEPIGIMRTPLSDEGYKAPVRNESGDFVDRWAVGRKKGGAIKLWLDGLITYRLVVGEGMETVAFTATRREHRGLPLQPAWALIDAGNLATMPPLAGIETLIILVDNDENGTGQRKAMECARNQYATGCRDIEFLTPNNAGEDFADLATMGRPS